MTPTKTIAKLRRGRPSDGIDRERVSFYLPAKLRALLRDAALEHGISINQFLAVLLAKHFRKHPPKPRVRGQIDLKSLIDKLL